MPRGRQCEQHDVPLRFLLLRNFVLTEFFEIGEKLQLQRCPVRKRVYAPRTHNIVSDTTGFVFGGCGIDGIGSGEKAEDESSQLCNVQEG